MPRPFRVVVIDDKAAACNAVARKLTGALPPSSMNAAVVLESVAVHVLVRPAGEPAVHDWTFDASMIAALDEASQHSPDLVIIDHFYVDEGTGAALKQKAVKEGVRAEELKQSALSPVDLRRWIEDNATLDSSLRRRILQRLFGAACPVYLHSYTPHGFEDVAGTTEDRVRTLATVFPHAKRFVVDTRREFYLDDTFDPKGDGQGSKYDSKYYAFQLSAFFMQIAQIEVLRKQLNAARYLRLNRTSSSVAGIIVIGAAIGFAAGWLGDVFGALMSDGRYAPAAVVGIGCFIVLLGLGTACPFLFEFLMRRLMPLNSREDG